MLSLGPRHYFAIVDDRHDIKDPVTVVRVFDGAGPAGVRELSADVVWARSTLLDRIASGEVPYRAKPITEKQALRIRERREKTISFRYSVLIREDDPDDAEPVSVIREWTSATTGQVYEERYAGRQIYQWMPSNERWMSENGRDDTKYRLVATDAATVHQYIEALNGW